MRFDTVIFFSPALQKWIVQKYFAYYQFFLRLSKFDAHKKSLGMAILKFPT